jgi:NAD(P)H-dependent FMN reductase
MHVLGIVGSARRWGNSELLVREVLRGAREAGADASLVRLTELAIEPCTGCLRCVIGGKPRPVDDDVDWLIDTIDDAGALVLAVPTYFLGPAAIVKLLLDRLLMVTARFADTLPPARPAVTIATAGLEGWRGVTLPYLNALVAAFGFRPIDSLTAIAPGPGEVLLDETLMARLSGAGRRLGRGELAPTPAPGNTCPTCRCDTFRLDGDRATCPICGRAATLTHDATQVNLTFDPAGDDGHRWTPERLRAHIVDWVMATGPRFMERRHEIKTRRRPYREMDVAWLSPPDEEDAP